MQTQQEDDMLPAQTTLSDMTDQVFQGADLAHRQHFVTRSFASHAALGEFYPAVREALDNFVEAAIALDLAPPSADQPETLAILEESYAEMITNRDDVCQGNATLEALHDNISAVYLKAIYKLKRLSMSA